jgi:superfamily II DNA or RNA helicase
MLRFKSIPDADDVEKDARRAASDVRRFRATVSLCENLGRKGSTLVFSGSIDHAVALALVLRRRGVSAAWVSSRMSVSERERALRRFEAGATKVLVNKALVATGYDCPAVSDVVLTVPVRSSVLFEQMVGRAARGPAIGGNKNATVWSFDDHVGIHGAPSSYHRYALAGWR